MKISDLDDLTFDDNNANRGTERGRETVKKSLDDYGAGRSVLVDKNGKLIAGNKTVEAAKAKGMKVRVVETVGDELVVVQRTDLDLTADEKARLLAYADNRASELGLDWDKEAFMKDLDSGLDLSSLFSDKDLLKVGLTLDDLNKLGGGGGSAPEAKLDAAEELQAKWGVESGDMYLIGNHRLLCGDSTKPEDVEKVCDGKAAVDLCVTDPPYNVNYQGGTDDKLKIENDNMNDADFYQFLLAFYKGVNHVLKPGSALYVFHAEGNGGMEIPFRRAFMDAGLELKQCCIWVKDRLVLGRQDFHQQHEPILYGWKPGAAHKWNLDRTQTTVWNFKRPSVNDHHPTMKPIDLIEYPIRCSSEKDGVVFDPFLGSGSTMVAAERTQRKCYGLELDPKYCSVILERMSEMGLSPEKV